jgi:ParB family chromosome partitioning protein
MSNYQSNEIKLINTSLIDPHPDNPRKQIGDVTDLAASIKANGLLSPLSVVPNGERYRVIAGHRRLAAGTPEETIEELRKQNPDAVSVHEATQTIYLWDRRDAAAEAEKEAQRAAEQAERDARQHVLEEYAATTADKRMAWLHGHLHAIKRAKLIETTARLGLLQTIDPDPTGFTKDLHTWNDAACAREQFAAIAGIKPEQALAELHTHLDSPDWPTYAVMILTARIEWFISPNDWDWSGDDNVSRRIPGYYLILQDLGYEPSDDETEHLDQLVAAITEEDEEEDE